MSSDYYIQNIDEFFAEFVLSSRSNTLFKISLKNSEGLLNIDIVNIGGKDESFDFPESEVDFELSGSECCGLIINDISEYKNKTVFSSSAYELLDQVFVKYNTLCCRVEMEDGSWKIGIFDFY